MRAVNEGLPMSLGLQKVPQVHDHSTAVHLAFAVPPLPDDVDVGVDDDDSGARSDARSTVGNNTCR